VRASAPAAWPAVGVALAAAVGVALAVALALHPAAAGPWPAGSFAAAGAEDVSSQTGGLWGFWEPFAERRRAGVHPVGAEWLVDLPPPGAHGRAARLVEAVVGRPAVGRSPACHRQIPQRTYLRACL
jgi:hypothetical protein